ncbi:uncharacterized protein [Centruroides vittatus]|uniref:uncharacterized protein n=1 Tax=Centruroides vittatus TaxID=120091 RepID=UPI00350F20DD
MIAHKNSDRIAEIANRELEKIGRWSNMYKQPLNYHKCEAIVLTRKNRRSQLQRTIRVKINGKNIRNVQYLKYLGVFIDRSLNWHYHINYACNKAVERSNLLYSITRNTWGLDSRNTKLIYLQAIEPAILYGVQAWFEALGNKHVQKKLLSTQRKSAIRISKSYRTAPTDAILLISGLTPIHLKAKQITWNWYIINKHNEISDDNIEELQRKGELPPDKQKNLLKILKTDIDTELKTINSIKDPKINRRYETDMEFTTNANNNNSQMITAYTDGSKNENGVGSGVVVRKGERTLYQAALRLGEECSITQAEQWAILKAISYVNTHHPTTKNLQIYTDSRVALHTLNRMEPKTKLAAELIATANDMGKRMSISFNWIPAHKGYEGNELADKLAKMATGNDKTTYNRLPISYIHNYIKEETHILWQQEWEGSHTGRLCYRFLPTIKGRLQNKKLQPTFELTQCLTGHGAFNSYLHRFGKRDSNRCELDTENEETVHHFLFDCKKYDNLRTHLEKTSIEEGFNWPPGDSNLFSNNKLLKALTKFVRDCGALNPSLNRTQQT